MKGSILTKEKSDSEGGEDGNGMIILHCWDPKMLMQGPSTAFYILSRAREKNDGMKQSYARHDYAQTSGENTKSRIIKKLFRRW